MSSTIIKLWIQVKVGKKEMAVGIVHKLSKRSGVEEREEAR